MKRQLKRIVAVLLSFIMFATPVAINLEGAIVLKTNAAEITTSKTVTDKNLNYDVDISTKILTTGTCGKNLEWMLLRTGVLYIGGKGSMQNYDQSSLLPWFNYLDIIN